MSTNVEKTEGRFRVDFEDTEWIIRKIFRKLHEQIREIFGLFRKDDHKIYRNFGKI